MARVSNERDAGSSQYNELLPLPMPRVSFQTLRGVDAAVQMTLLINFFPARVPAVRASLDIFRIVASREYSKTFEPRYTQGWVAISACSPATPGAARPFLPGLQERKVEGTEGKARFNYHAVAPSIPGDQFPNRGLSQPFPPLFHPGSRGEGSD